MTINKNTPLVSVRLMTYNHEKFIRQAMDGIMSQKTNFPVEVVVGDDFSADNTLNIIKSYSSSQNIHIRILERRIGDEYWKKRQEKGRLYNFINILENCQGKYVALLDGDDYWTNPLKLQKQVDFMERNEDCSIVFHACNRIQGNVPKIIRHTGSTKMDLNDYLIEQPFTATASLVFKSKVINRYEAWMLKLFAGDFVLRYLALLEGKMGYINEVMCVYNKGVGGSWSQRKLTKSVILKEYRDNLKMLSYVTLHHSGNIAQGANLKKKNLKAGTYFKKAHTMSYFSGVCFLINNVKIVGRRRIMVFLIKGVR